MSFLNPEFKNYIDRKEIKCEVEYCDEIESEINGKKMIRPGVRVTCSECDHSVESLGQSNKSIKRCLALLCEECPNEENNWYTAVDKYGIEV